MKSIQRIVLLGVVLVLALSLVVSCAAPAPAPAPAQTVTVTAPAPTMEPQKWDMITSAATLEDYTEQLWVEATERIKVRTDGLLDIRYVPNGALPIKPEDWLRAVSDGELAICNIVAGYHAGDYPILAFLEVPLVYTNMLEREIVYREVLPVYEREMAKENIKLLPLWLAGGYAMVTREPVDLMNLDGTQIRTYGTTVPKILEATGGVGVPIAWSEAYTALERGVVDGILTGVHGIYGANMHKLCPHIYDTGMVIDPDPWAINKELWDALPKDIQNIVSEELGMASRANSLYAYMNQQEVFNMMLAEAGPDGTFEVAPPEYIDTIREKVTKVMLAELLAETGTAGSDVVAAMEKATGATLR